MTYDVRPGGPIDTYHAVIAELRDKAANAARRGKPTMWGYYLDQAEMLTVWFANCSPTDGGFAGAALALSQRAERICADPSSGRCEAVRAWAMGVYARRILRAWGAGIGSRPPSLDWLRERAGVASPQGALL